MGAFISACPVLPSLPQCIFTIFRGKPNINRQRSADNGNVSGQADDEQTGNRGGHSDQLVSMKKKLKPVASLSTNKDGRSPDDPETDNCNQDTTISSCDSPLTARRAESMEKPDTKPEWADQKLRPVSRTRSNKANEEFDDQSAPSVRVAKLRFEALQDSHPDNNRRRSFTTDDIDTIKNLTNLDKLPNNQQDTSLLKKRPKLMQFLLYLSHATPKPRRLHLGGNGRTQSHNTNLKSAKKLNRSWNALTKDCVNSTPSSPVAVDCTAQSPAESGTKCRNGRLGPSVSNASDKSGHQTTDDTSEFQTVFSKMRQKMNRRSEKTSVVSGDGRYEDPVCDGEATLTRENVGRIPDRISSKSNAALYSARTVGSTNAGTVELRRSKTSDAVKSRDSLSNVSNSSVCTESDSDSDADDFEGFSSDSDVNPVVNLSATQQLMYDLELDTQPRSKLYKKAYELLSTERSYVNRLNLIEQFSTTIDAENKKHKLFPDETIVQMFSNIKSIQQFHQQHLLPALEQRMKEWDTDAKLGDILSHLAPFLKIYTQYVSNYDSASKLILSTYQKCAKFKSIIDDLQTRPECNNLALQHHMLEPIQRVPRYELLVKDYLRLLPDDSPDKEPTQRALTLVMKAAEHNNEALKKMDRFHQLLQIHEQLAGVLPDVVSPTRVLIKQGKLTKVSRRNGALMDRYIFLFNDLILVCSEQNMSALIGTVSYRLHDKLSVEGMKAYNGDNPNLPNTFHIKTREKVIEFFVNDVEENAAWQAALWRVANDYQKKKKSFNRNVEPYDCGIDDNMVGKTAPKWIKDDEASMCMVCGFRFTRLKRRHHCRACGIVVCSACSDYKRRLEYDDKVHRVCNRCYDILSAGDGVQVSEEAVSEADTASSTTTNNGQTLRRKKLLETKATAPALISSFLNTSLDQGKSWVKKWCAIHSDFVMYTFIGRQDIKAASSLALPGYELKLHEKNEFYTPSHVFSLSHAAVGVQLFDAMDVVTLEKWRRVLEKVLVAELPGSEPEPPLNSSF